MNRKCSEQTLQENDLWLYNLLIDKSLSNSNIPLDVIMCENFNGKNQPQ